MFATREPIGHRVRLKGLGHERITVKCFDKINTVVPGSVPDP
jgi:hypothetical protein